MTTSELSKGETDHCTSLGTFVRSEGNVMLSHMRRCYPVKDELTFFKIVCCLKVDTSETFWGRLKCYFEILIVYVCNQIADNDG